MEKTYINGASIKEIKGQFGSFFNMSFNLEKLQEYSNEKGYVNMTVSKRREPSQYGETHYAVLNEWKKEEHNETPSSNVKNGEDEINISDIPFK